MTHTFFALFDTPADAEAAVTALERIGTHRSHCEIVTHRGPLHDADTGDAESAARSGAILGAVLGGVLGAALGAVVSQFLGIGVASVVLLGAAGVGSGGLFGAIGGAASLDRSLERMAPTLEHERVVLTVTAPDLRSGELAESLLAERGVHVEHRAVL